MKWSKSQLPKIGQSGKFLGRLLGPLLKSGLHLIGNELKELAKSVLIPLGLTAAASTADAPIHKKMFGTTTLIILNEEMNNIMKIVKSLEESRSLIKDFSQTIKNEAKEQKRAFLWMLLGTLGASLLKNLLTGKKEIAASQGLEDSMPGRSSIRAGEGTVRTGENNVTVGQDF